MHPETHIVICRCRQARVYPAAVEAKLREGLCLAGISFEVVEDLCEWSARQPMEMAKLAGWNKLKIAACHPRAVRWLFAAAGAPLKTETTQLIDLRAAPVEAEAALKGDFVPNLDEQKTYPVNREKSHAVPAGHDQAEAGQWVSWFPVIDYARCTNCMQCLSFCLFGVYGVDASHRIRVENPVNCKNNCPACSRVCPEVAIMFPKYPAGPINGRAVAEADAQREKIKVDISALLGGDIYSLLRQRSEQAGQRFSRERDPEKALKERQKCMAKLVEEGGIPPEVLMALPSLEEIQRRAEEAKAKAQAALQEKAKP